MSCGLEMSCGLGTSYGLGTSAVWEGDHCTTMTKGIPLRLVVFPTPYSCALLSVVKMLKLMLMSSAFACIIHVAHDVKRDAQSVSEERHRAATGLQNTLHQIIPVAEQRMKSVATHLAKQYCEKVCGWRVTPFLSSVCLSVCLSVSCLSLSVSCLVVYLCVCLCLSVCLSVCLCLFVYLCVCLLSVCLSVCLCLCVYLIVCLSCLSVCVFVCLSVCLVVRLSARGRKLTVLHSSPSLQLIAPLPDAKVVTSLQLMAWCTASGELHNGQEPSAIHQAFLKVCGWSF